MKNTGLLTPICPLMLLLAGFSALRADTQEKPAYLEEIIITATRHETESLYIPNTVQLFTEQELREDQQIRTIPEVLGTVPGVLSQKTGHAQGSPFIRGFTGFRTLFLIDGIRLNNSVFRDGPNQYWNTVDPYSIQQLEVVKGPSAVLYGSDAIGGTVNAIAIGPDLEDPGYQGGVLYRGATAERSHTVRLESGYAAQGRWGLYAGLTGKDFGELEGGHEIGTMSNTGYDEWDADFKAVYQYDAGRRMILAFQHVDQNDASRTHKTVDGIRFAGTTIGDEKKRELDQTRTLAYMKYESEHPLSFVNAYAITLSWHRQEEERERIRSDDRRDVQGFDVDTLGLGLQMESESDFGIWTYGLEYYRDDVESFKKNFDATGAFTGNSIQGPVGDDASYDLLGVYVQDEVPLGGQWTLTPGFRLTFAKADADKVEDPETGNTIRVADEWWDVTGSLRALYALDDAWVIFGGVSQGFRAPNLSDLTRLDTARTDEIETPSPGLDPEHFVSLEVGAKGNWHEVTAEASYFYTLIEDMIIRFPTGRVIAGDSEIQKENAGDGFVHGVELAATYHLPAGWSLWGNLTWMDGAVDTFPTSAKNKKRETLDRLMPLSSVTGVRWDAGDGRWWGMLQARMADRQDDLSTRDQNDTQRIPPDGTPGYVVLDIRGGWRFHADGSVTLGLENLLDKDYRVHGSGVNAPGLNAVLTAMFSF